MSATVTCDGCGKTAPMSPGGVKQWFQPYSWYSRQDDDGLQDACSLQCIEKVAAKSGKTRVVLPI